MAEEEVTVIKQWEILLPGFLNYLRGKTKASKNRNKPSKIAVK